MKVGYCEYMGDNWTAHFRIEQSQTSIEIEGDTPEQMLKCILRKYMVGTSNNVEVCIFPYYIRWGKSISYWQDNGVDLERTTKQKVLDYLATFSDQLHPPKAGCNSRYYPALNSSSQDN